MSDPSPSPAVTCPTCGQAVVTEVASQRALWVLRAPVDVGRYRGARSQIRELYRGDGTATWYPTYAADFRHRVAFSEVTVRSLYNAGLVEPVYPTMRNPMDCVRLAHGTGTTPEEDAG